MNNKELLILKMKIFLEKANLMDLTEFALELSILASDAWKTVAADKMPCDTAIKE